MMTPIGVASNSRRNASFGEDLGTSKSLLTNSLSKFSNSWTSQKQKSRLAYLRSCLIYNVILCQLLILDILSQPKSTPVTIWLNYIFTLWPYKLWKLHHISCGYSTQTLQALPGNLGSWFSVCNLILTQQEDIWF